MLDPTLLLLLPQQEAPKNVLALTISIKKSFDSERDVGSKYDDKGGVESVPNLISRSAKTHSTAQQEHTLAM